MEEPLFSCAVATLARRVNKRMGEGYHGAAGRRAVSRLDTGLLWESADLECCKIERRAWGESMARDLDRIDC